MKIATLLIRRKWILVATIALMAVPSPALLRAQGVLYFVNTTSDVTIPGRCANGLAGCSLRGAIEAANANLGDDGIEIDLPAGSIIDLTGVLPNITEGVDISGPGADQLTVRRNTGGNYRIFDVTTTGTVTFSGLTISGGNLDVGSGGGISNSAGTVNIITCTVSSNFAAAGGGISNSSGTVNVTNSTIRSNFGDLYGGGIENDSGTLNVTDSTVSGNNSPNVHGSGGGGIYNFSGTVTITNSAIKNNISNSTGGGIANDTSSGTVNVTNSTISGNSVPDDNGGGGGISNFGTMNITNSTISGNTVQNVGGGIASAGNAAALSVTNSTISGNQAIEGGGIYNPDVAANIKSSIIALNTSGSGNNAPDAFGSFASAGFNLIGKIDGSTGFTAPTDQTGTFASPLDPKLGPLKDNGGPTETMALLTGSPAVDKGTSAGLNGGLIADQRGVGYARKIDKSVANATGGDGTDIGAFELGAQIKAVSRKNHGSAGAFDINLPLFGPKLGVECRKGGSSHVFQLLLTFPRAVTVGSASAMPDPTAPGATGSISSMSVNGKIVTINLTGVSNAQRFHVTLFGVSDGASSNDVSVSMGVLFCDTNNNGAVADTDVSLTQSKIGQTLSKTNFREDVDLNGSINSTDVNMVTSNKGKKLP